MKKFKITALIIACILMFSGCSLVSPDEERIANQVVAEVNGVEIYRYDVDNIVKQYAPIYGIDLESEDESVREQIEQLRDFTLDNLVINELLIQKASDLGISLTEEEKQENINRANEDLENLKEQYRTAVEQEAENDETIDVEAEAEKRYNQQLEDQNFSLENYISTLNEQTLVGKVEEHINAQAEVTDEDTKKWYDENAETQKEELTESPGRFESYVHQKNPYTYIPEDTIAVKQVLLKFEDEELVEKATTMFNEGSEAAAMALLQPEIDKLMPKALEVKKRLEDGESIDALIEELGEDSGMTVDPAMTFGYLVNSGTENYLSAFTEAALKLKNVGDISEPVATYYGLHILQTIKVYEAGVVPYEDVKEAIREKLLPDKQQELYGQMTDEWKEAADIKYYRNRLN